MSYETPEQKKLLEELEIVAAKCFAAGIKHGKALMALNLGYGQDRGPRELYNPTAEQHNRIFDARERVKQEVRANHEVSAKRTAAFVLARMTGEQVRLSRKLPEEMLAQVSDDQMVGEVFSLDQLEAIL